jgi:hypothetical protein
VKSIGSKSDPERGLTAYVLLALNDRLVADLGTQWLYAYLRRAPADLRVEEVRNFIRRAGETDHPEVRDWTEDTQLHLAQHYMASIRDFGLARGKSKKLSLRPALYGAPVRLLVRALRLARVNDLEIVASPVFRLLALEGAPPFRAVKDTMTRRLFLLAAAAVTLCAEDFSGKVVAISDGDTIRVPEGFHKVAGARETERNFTYGDMPPRGTYAELAVDVIPPANAEWFDIKTIYRCKTCTIDKEALAGRVIVEKK